MFVTAFKFLLSKQGLIAVALAAAFLAGWYVADTFAEAEKAEALAELVDDQKRATRQVIDQQKALRALDAELTDNLMVELAKNSEREKIVVKEVIKYVPEDPAGRCNLSRGAVGLLNNARGYSDTGGVPTAPELSAEESAAQSSLDQRAEVSAHADCALRYEELRLRHNALIDWIERRQEQR